MFNFRIIIGLLVLLSLDTVAEEQEKCGPYDGVNLISKPELLNKILESHNECVSKTPNDLTCRAKLCNAILKGIDLGEANLKGANLSGANLSGASLSKANLNGAYLNKANLKGALLSGVNLNGAYLLEADLSRAYLFNANLTRAYAIRTDLSGARLGGANLKGIDLSGADLSGANLNNTDLKEAILYKANLGGAKLSGADLSGAKLLEANLSGTNLNGANLGKASLVKADLSGASLSKANLNGAYLNKANLKGAYLSGLDLKETNLSGANLSGANLNGADLKGINLKRIDLSGADLSGADLSNTDLSGANLTKAIIVKSDLKNAKTANTNFGFANYDPVTIPLKAYLGGIKGISSTHFNKGNHSGLVTLRAALKEVGLRELEREATYAIESGKTRYSQGPEKWFRLIFFEWTSSYGLNYERPVLILLCMLLPFAAVYYFSIAGYGSSRVYRVWSEERIEEGTASGKPERHIEPLTFGIRKNPLSILKFSIYFSILSAFHIGWRDLNVGNWITRLQPREYTLRARGWIKTVSGLQSLISIYLLALWVLVYFGRPFQ